MSNRRHQRQPDRGKSSEADSTITKPPEGTSLGKNPATSRTEPSSAPCNCKTGTKKLSDPNWWMVWLTAALGVFAFASFIVVYCQLAESHHDFIVDQRAWVGDFGADPLSIEANSRVIAAIRLKNTGKTPAINGKMVTNNAFSPVGQEFTPVFWCDKDAPKQGSSLLLLPEGTIGAVTHYPRPFPNCGVPLDSPTAMSDFLDGKGNNLWYVFGEIQYDDIFGCHHSTQFCDVYTPEKPPRVLTCTTHTQAKDYTCNK